MEQTGKIDDFKVPWSVADVFKGVGLLFLTNVVAGGVLIAANYVLRLNESLFILILTFLSFFLTIFIVWFFSIRKYHIDYHLLGIRVDRSFAQIPAIIVAVASVFMIENLYALILFLVTRMEPPEQEIFKIFGNNLVLVIFMVAVLAPISEELFFRGFVYSALRTKMGKAKAVIMSAAIFSFFHLIPLLFIPLLAIGIALALLYEYKKSLVAPIVMHALNNLTAVLLLYYFGGK